MTRSVPGAGEKPAAWRKWLQRWFGAPGSEDGRHTSPPGLLRAEERGSEAPAPSSTAAAASDPLVALGIQPAEPPVLSEAQQAEVERLVAAIKAHFAAARDDLEMLPSSCLRILNLVSRPDLELGELTSVASQDPAISAAVLRVANSAAVGGTGREVRTVRDAIARLGVAEVGHVAAAVSARVLFSARAKAEQAMFASRRTDLHWRAVTAAAGAAHLSMQRRTGRSDLAYLGGMMHDVGKAVALGSLCSLAVAGRAPREIETAVLDAVLEQVHTEIGTDALRHWSMPGYLVTLCATHHDPKLPEGPENVEVHLVRVVAGLLAVRANPGDAEALELMLQSADVLHLQPLELRALDSDLRGLAKQMGRVLGLGGSQGAVPRRPKVNA